MAFNKVWQFKEITIVHETTGAAGTLTFSTDLPTGVMAVRTTKNLATTTGRQDVTEPLDGIEGRMFQVKVQAGAGGITRLFSGSVKARPIGVYLDGAKGDIWESQPRSLG